MIERRFAMLADSAFLASMPHELRATLRAAGITVIAAPSSGVDAWLARRSVLIRPDAYVHATANSHDDLSIAVFSLARAFGTAALANIGRRYSHA